MNNLSFLVSEEAWEEGKFKAHPSISETMCCTKSMIERFDRKRWNFFRSLCNPYENIFSKSRLTNSKPISRAYYKIMELSKDHDLLNSSQAMSILCLAEAPGAFVQYFLDSRYKCSDNITCNTLNLPGVDIPKFHHAVTSANSVELYSGPDNSGDICKYEIVTDLLNGKKFDLITGDGGIDVSSDHNSQDKQCMKLVLCEVIIGMGCLKKNGNMTIKLFDIQDIEIVKVLAILSKAFSSVHLTKPRSSRPANSEKYVVCKSLECTAGLDTLVYSLRNNTPIHWHITDNFSKHIEEIRCIFATHQINSLQYIMSVIDGECVVDRKLHQRFCNEWFDKYKINDEPH
tara:strand:- start:94 stop:1125 length:1032 start_codon:yes stop_codon:yes gene_type:complete